MPCAKGFCGMGYSTDSQFTADCMQVKFFGVAKWSTPGRIFKVAFGRASIRGSTGPAKSWSPRITRTGVVRVARVSGVMGGRSLCRKAERARRSDSGELARKEKCWAMGLSGGALPSMASRTIWPCSGSCWNTLLPTPATTSRLNFSGEREASASRRCPPIEKPTASS